MIITIPIIIVAVSFSVTNLEPVTLGLWPLPFEIAMPKYLVVLVPLALGLVIGGLLAWMSGAKHRRQAHRQSRRIAALRDELKRSRERLATVDAATSQEAESARVEAAARAASEAARKEQLPPPGPRTTPAIEVH